MLFRQLQRPLARSVAAAASSPTWRTALLHGSSQQQRSLLEQLFPGETRRPRGDGSGSTANGLGVESQWAPKLLEDQTAPEMEPLVLPEELDLPLEQDASLAATKCMLILSAASSNLVESDFLRLGAKGRHVEGWVNGLIKGRDSRVQPMLANSSAAISDAKSEEKEKG